MAVVEIEIDTPGNGNLFFGPIQETVRGRLDFLRVREKEARAMLDDFPCGIPGQRIGYDLAAGEGYVAEPLHEPPHAAVRARLEARKFALPPARRALTGHGAHAPTMLHWMRRAVEGGAARVVLGRFPDQIQGEPVTDFLHKRPAASEKDKALKTVLALMYAKLPAGERKAFDELMAAI